MPDDSLGFRPRHGYLLVRRLAARRFGPGVVQRLAPLLGELSGPESVAAVADAVIECETAEEFIDRVREA